MELDLILRSRSDEDFRNLSDADFLPGTSEGFWIGIETLVSRFGSPVTLPSRCFVCYEKKKGKKNRRKLRKIGKKGLKNKSVISETEFGS